MFHDLDSTLKAILDDATAPTELHDADVSFENRIETLRRGTNGEPLSL